MTGTSSKLVSFDCSASNSIMVLTNRSTHSISGRGDANQTLSLSLSSFLYVTKFPFSFLSISKLTKALNCSITFYPSFYIFQNLKMRKMIGGRHEINNPYYLDGDPRGGGAAILSFNVSPLQ